ncbi:hypothetical protein IFM89_024971 [Coptis chinensis]|uniref:Glycosyltransferase n=1 Tax=Coptis chinensis TaxID=261450 RepID=A0A835HXR7_9MAGN|nr:hypothetical protein IFM89_024971 [Coptis chinensis]
MIESRPQLLGVIVAMALKAILHGCERTWLAVTYGLRLNGLQARVVEYFGHLEGLMMSVERILQYTRIPNEPPLVIEAHRPDHNWPSHGDVVIHNLQVRYSPHMPLILQVTPEFIHNRIASKVESSIDGISYLSIPDGFDENEPRDFFTISYAMENNMPIHFQNILSGLNKDGEVVCVVVDLLASWAIQVAKSSKIPVAGFWPAMLATYNLIKAIPNMIQLGLISESGRKFIDFLLDDYTGTPQHQGTKRFLPGEPMLRVEDLPWLIGNTAQRRKRFRFWMQALNRSKGLPWLLVNSFEEDMNAENHHRKNISTESHINYAQVFQVAPLTWNSCKNPSFWEEDRSCVKWLDNQEQNSVIYVSFGSWVGPIEQEKVTELALGLESTSRPFIWVLGVKWRNGLPVGYLERVSRYGKVVSWAPQKEVLKHKAVGCYITHCGWNSTMEAIECGKKLLCHPIAGDQFVNCTYIVKLWKIGVKMDSMGRYDVEKGVRKVMEDGEQMQLNVMKMKERIGTDGILRARNCLALFSIELKKSIIGYYTSEVKV